MRVALQATVGMRSRAAIEATVGMQEATQATAGMRTRVAFQATVGMRIRAAMEAIVGMRMRAARSVRLHQQQARAIPKKTKMTRRRRPLPLRSDHIALLCFIRATPHPRRTQCVTSSTSYTGMKWSSASCHALRRHVVLVEPEAISYSARPCHRALGLT